MFSPLACIVNGALLLKGARLPVPCSIGLEENVGVKIIGSVSNETHAAQSRMYYSCAINLTELLRKCPVGQCRCDKGQANDQMQHGV